MTATTQVQMAGFVVAIAITLYTAARILTDALNTRNQLRASTQIRQPIRVWTVLPFRWAARAALLWHYPDWRTWLIFRAEQKGPVTGWDCWFIVRIQPEGE